MNSKKIDKKEQNDDLGGGKKSNSQSRSPLKTRTALPEEERSKRGRKIILILFVVSTVASYIFYLQR
jgi:hypothetical protein